MIRLARPHVRFQRSYLAAHDEFAGAMRDGDGVWVEAPDGRGYSGTDFGRAEMETAAGFARYVAWRLDSSLEDSPRTHGHVPCTYFWVFDDADPDTYLGTVSIRHRLTPFLLAIGGHVGYSVRPSARRRGVATRALRLLLPHAAALGIDPVLITCDVDNIGSAKVIEANGGVLEDVWEGKNRYWVPSRRRSRRST